MVNGTVGCRGGSRREKFLGREEDRAIWGICEYLRYWWCWVANHSLLLWLGRQLAWCKMCLLRAGCGMTWWLGWFGIFVCKTYGLNTAALWVTLPRAGMAVPSAYRTSFNDWKGGKLKSNLAENCLGPAVVVPWAMRPELWGLSYEIGPLLVVHVHVCLSLLMCWYRSCADWLVPNDMICTNSNVDSVEVVDGVPWPDVHVTCTSECEHWLMSAMKHVNEWLWGARVSEQSSPEWHGCCKSNLVQMMGYCAVKWMLPVLLIWIPSPLGNETPFRSSLLW